MASKAAASAAIDFPRLIQNLKLGRETVAALQAFRKRNHDAQLAKNTLAAQPTSVDIAYYRSVLKNQAVVDQAEKALKDFKPVTYDVAAHIKAIEAFEGKAVEKAELTVAKIDEELKDLQATLANIEEARPFEDLTVDDVGNAHPAIFKAADTALTKGKWTVPGYNEKFGNLSLL
ncbi:mitochondrial ATP synthase [Exidia glandulosa HHB12029]|uniref:ATP synthase subunit d, mitochondrial n=1 Tax=Exidia glandulosa HHB12029 TaxID=1314781 RepID=A0A165QPK8_EXIGL|nr:mitochondrial ATP synthase [Exidia glandulosa HHB12029]